MAFDPTALFTALANFFKLGDDLSPALIQWIEAQIPAEQQRVMTRRLRRCKRYCRRNKITGALILDTVEDLFEDQTADMQVKIAAIMEGELAPYSAKNG